MITIKAIIFDADGLLVNEDKKYFSAFLEEEFGVSKAKTNEFFNYVFLDCIVGKKDLKDVLPGYLKEWAVPMSFDEALKYWHVKEHVMNEPLLSELKSFRDKNIKLFVATNQEKYRVAYMLKEMEFAKLFEKTFASYALGYKKPDKMYFENMLKEMEAFDPKEILFWDDREENVASARESGIQAEQYQNFKQFKKIMKEKFNL